MPQAVACVSLVLLCPPISSEVYRLRTATISDQLYTNLHQFYSCDLMNRRTIFFLNFGQAGATLDRSIVFGQILDKEQKQQ